MFRFCRIVSTLSTYLLEYDDPDFLLADRFFLLPLRAFWSLLSIKHSFSTSRVMLVYASSAMLDREFLTLLWWVELVGG